MTYGLDQYRYRFTLEIYWAKTSYYCEYSLYKKKCIHIIHKTSNKVRLSIN